MYGSCGSDGGVDELISCILSRWKGSPSWFCRWSSGPGLQTPLEAPCRVGGIGACSNGGSLAQRSRGTHPGPRRSAPEVGRLDSAGPHRLFSKGLVVSHGHCQVQGSGSLDGGAGRRRCPWARAEPSPRLHADEGRAVPSSEARVSALPSAGRPLAETEAGPSSSLCPRSGPQTSVPVHSGHRQVLGQVPRASPAAPAPGGPHAGTQHAPGSLCECPAPPGGT